MSNPAKQHEPAEETASASLGDRPLTFLGYHDGLHHFLSPGGHRHALSAAKLGQWPELLNLFGKKQGWLENAFPPKTKRSGSTFDVYKAARWLIRQSYMVEQSQNAPPLRRSGVWCDKDDPDQLRVHLGDKVVKRSVPLPLADLPADIGFAQCKWLIHWPEEDGAIEDALRAVDALETFDFTDRAYLDLLIGFIAVSFFGGAPAWRPHVYLTAPRGAGKSMLIEVMAAILGDICFLAGQDATRAYILQSLDGRAAAVLIDEAEAGGANKIENTLELARHASDGDGAFVGRGTPSGHAQNFFFSGSFFLCGIQSPMLTAQDRSRFAQISLRPPTERQYLASDLDALTDMIATLEKRSGHLLKHMVRRWPAYRAAERAYRAALQDEFGKTGRFAMQAGALLAGYDVFTMDEARPADDVMDRITSVMPALETAMAVDEPEPGEQVLQYLVSKVPRWLAIDQRLTVGEMIAEALKEAPKSYERQLLRRLGITFPRKEPDYVALAHNHAGLEELFQGTAWEHGDWRHPVRQLEGTKAGNHAVKLEGKSARTTLVPLSRLITQGDDA